MALDQKVSRGTRVQGSWRPVLLPVEKIVTSLFGMRVSYRRIGELAVSIKRHGLLHPIAVRPSGQGFELIAGHRRLEACKLLGWREVPCLVMNVSDKEGYELALVENVQRETLDPVEEAEAYQRYVSRFGWGSIGELARKIGKSDEYVSHRTLLLRLPGEILEKVRSGQLTPWQAQELAWVKDSVVITELTSSVIEHRLTVKQIREVRKKIKEGSQIRDAVNQVTCSGRPRRFSGGSVGERCWMDVLGGLKQAYRGLDRGMKDASRCEDERLRIFLTKKKRVVQRLIHDLHQEREND